MDISNTIAPKSDQMNFDDFIGKESKTIKITKVVGKDDPQQPVAIHYEGDNGKPYKPCLSMRRVLVAVWGANATKYTGRSLILYGDPTVKFGGMAVGGIRISHMSDISQPVTLPLSVSKANKKPFTVKPMIAGQKLELTPESKGWEGARNAIKSGTHTIEQIREKYDLSDDNAKLLSE